MRNHAHLYLNIAIAAIAAAGIVVGITLDTRSTPPQPTPHAGRPPVPSGLPGAVGRRIEAAYRQSWPSGSIDALQTLGLEYAGGPTVTERHEGALVQYYRGVALLWAGYPSDAESALELAKKLGTNTLIHNRADEILHPDYLQPTTPPYYPVFVPIQPNKLLEKGSRLQTEGRQHSAEEVYQHAAKLYPNDVEAQVAAAVGRFDEDNLDPAFGHLSPLTARFPHSQIVHYYLGYLLAWTAQPKEAIAQFEQTVKLGPKTKLGKQTTSLLEQIANGGQSASGQ